MAGCHESESLRELKNEATSELVKREQEAWQNMLGTRVEVKPLPESVTPEVRRKLERLGFDLRYIPRLELGTIDDIRRDNIRHRSVERYLKNLQLVYPKWKPFESLSDRELRDHSVPRNLEQWFWQHVKSGEIDFPVLPGQWMAVETLEKPAYGRKYSITPFAEKLGFRDDRFNVTWNEANVPMDRQKRRILSEIGLPSRQADLRLLDSLEWNLLGNREGWGKTDAYEWTNTEYLRSSASRRLIVGGSGHGGVANVYWSHPDVSRGSVGFRAAVILGS